MDADRLFQQMPDLLVCRDGERNILKVNQAFAAAFGQTPDRWVGQQLDGAVSGAQIGALDENRAYGHIEIDGQMNWIEWIETPLAEGGSLAVGRLNPDRRRRDRSMEPGQRCRRNNPAVVYQPLPFLPPEPAAKSRSTAPRTTPAAATASQVLLAEDDPLNAKLACALLERSGCVVTHVSDGCEALEMARKRTFDMVFMDVRMPNMDGLAATRAIRELAGTWLDIPIIALTANAFSEDKRACHRAGMNGFLTKPISVDALMAAQKHWTQPQNRAKTG